MEFYSWKKCPQKYKDLAPFTKHFFDTCEVKLVAVINRPKDTIVNHVLSRLEAYTDSVSTAEVQVLYWTVEHGNPIPNKPKILEPSSSL